MRIAFKVEQLRKSRFGFDALFFERHDLFSEIFALELQDFVFDNHMAVTVLQSAWDGLPEDFNFKSVDGAIGDDGFVLKIGRFPDAEVFASVEMLLNLYPEIVLVLPKANNVQIAGFNVDIDGKRADENRVEIAE